VNTNIVSQNTDSTLVYLGFAGFQRSQLIEQNETLYVAASELYYEVSLGNAVCQKLQANICLNRIAAQNNDSAKIESQYQQFLQNYHDASTQLASKQNLLVSLYAARDECEQNFNTANQSIQQTLDEAYNGQFKGLDDIKNDLCNSSNKNNYQNQLCNNVQSFVGCVNNVSSEISTFWDHISIKFNIDYTENSTCDDVDNIASRIRAIVCATFTTKIENVVVGASSSSKRNWNPSEMVANITNSPGSLPPNQLFQNISCEYINVPIPTTSSSELSANLQNAQQYITEWVSLLESSSVTELNGIVADLESQLQSLLSTKTSVDDDATNSYQETEKYVNQKQQQTPQTDYTSPDISNEILQDGLDQYNGTVNQLYYAKIQLQQTIVNLQISFLNSKINFTRIIIESKENSSDSTIPIKKQAFIVIITNLWNQFSCYNVTYQNVTDTYSNWESKYESEKQQLQDKMDKIANKAWQSVQQIKADWSSNTDEIRQIIRNYIEQEVSTCNITSDDYSGVDDDSSNLNISWILEVTDDNSTTLDNLREVIQHVVAANAVVELSSVTVNIQKYQKRSASYSASASVSSTSSPSPSDINNATIIGGVIGGIAAVVILIVVLAFIFKKHSNTESI
jgi:mRNA-degrading endonuclease HigB of HigAB toxin-antitoxin module